MLKNSIRYKLIILFVLIALLPLAVMGYFINKNLETTVLQMVQKTEEMGKRSLQSTRDTGSTAINDAVTQLDKKSTEAIELRTIEVAAKIADFLIERDLDILNLSVHSPSPQLYSNYIQTNTRDVILHSEHDFSKKDISEKIPKTISEANTIAWKNSDNKTNWHHTPPGNYRKNSKPLYKEITFIGTNGMEIIKVKNKRISDDLRDVSIKRNTYCMAEDYFKQGKGKKRNKNRFIKQ